MLSRVHFLSSLCTTTALDPGFWGRYAQCQPCFLITAHFARRYKGSGHCPTVVTAENTRNGGWRSEAFKRQAFMNTNSRLIYTGPIPSCSLLYKYCSISSWLPSYSCPIRHVYEYRHQRHALSFHDLATAGIIHCLTNSSGYSGIPLCLVNTRGDRVLGCCPQHALQQCGHCLLNLKDSWLGVLESTNTNGHL